MTTNPNTPQPTTALARTHPLQLSGAASAIMAALRTHPGATSAILAATAGAGRSTTTKALRHLEQTGLARRETAVPDGNGRPVNYWYIVPALDDGTPQHTVDADEPSTEDTSATVSTPDAEHITDTTEPSEPGGDRQDDDAADGEVPQGRYDLQPDSPDEPAQAAEADDSPTPAHTPEPSAAEEAEPLAEPQNAQPSALSSGNKTRLAPGALRQMVIDHLTAHPDEAFTATRISRSIDKSSGAIANALTTLTKQSIAEQVTERPRTYRLSATAPTRDDK